MDIQAQIRENALDLQDYLKDLKQWEQDIKKKDETLKRSPKTERVSINFCKTCITRSSPFHRSEIRFPKVQINFHHLVVSKQFYNCIS